MTRPLLTLGAMQGAVIILAVGGFLPWRRAFIWNASPSAPVGLYRLTTADSLRRGDLVAIAPPEPLARFLAEGGYLPLGVPLLKHVAAVAGQRVCRSGGVVSIDGAVAATALQRDRRGRPLPIWDGCYALGADEIFALNAPSDSLDSRYFGPLPTTSIIGRATPLWLPGDGLEVAP